MTKKCHKKNNRTSVVLITAGNRRKQCDSLLSRSKYDGQPADYAVVIYCAHSSTVVARERSK